MNNPTAMKRHTGKIANTGQRCVVAFMQIPGRDDHALVIPTDALPPRFEQAVMDIVNSPEGQNERDVAAVLGRRLMPDTGRSVLQTLHETGYLMAVPVGNVVMMPLANMPFPLVDLLRDMAALPGSNIKLPDTLPAATPIDRYNPYTANQVAQSVEEKHAIAANLLLEAQDFERIAHEKRERAYAYAPDLRPGTPSPVPVREQPDGSVMSMFGVASAPTTEAPAKSPAKSAAKTPRAPKTRKQSG